MAKKANGRSTSVYFVRHRRSYFRDRGYSEVFIDAYYKTLRREQNAIYQTNTRLAQKKQKLLPIPNDAGRRRASQRVFDKAVALCAAPAPQTCSTLLDCGVLRAHFAAEGYCDRAYF